MGGWDLLTCVHNTAKSNFLGYERRDYWNWMESLQKNNALHYELTHAKNLLEVRYAQRVRSHAAR